MVTNNTENYHPIILKLLGFFSTLKSKDPLLYHEFISRMVDYQDSIYVTFGDWMLVFRTSKNHKADYVNVDITNHLEINRAHLRKWSPTTCLICDESSDPSARLAWKNVIEKCKILKKIGLINFKVEFGAVTEIYLRVNP